MLALTSGQKACLVKQTHYIPGIIRPIGRNDKCTSTKMRKFRYFDHVVRALLHQYHQYCEWKEKWKGRGRGVDKGNPRSERCWN